MIKRLINIYHCYPFFSLLHKSLIYWKKNDHILNLKNFTIKNLLINHNDISQFYKKPYAYFSVREIKKGNEMISNIGINKKDKWITNMYSRGRVHLIRSFHDCILTTCKTIKADNPTLNCKSPHVFVSFLLLIHLC